MSDISVRFTAAGMHAITGFSPEQLPWLDISGVEFTIDVREGTGAITVTGTAPRERMGDIVKIAQESLEAIRAAQP
jgi:hypothetical protein